MLWSTWYQDIHLSANIKLSVEVLYTKILLQWRYVILGGTFHWRYLVLRSTVQYRYLILGGTWYNSVQGSGPVSGRGAPPCVEPSPHIHFQPFSLVFNLSSTAVLFVGNLLPFVHKRSLLVNVTGRELLCVGPIIMIMAGRKIEGCCPRAALH